MPNSGDREGGLERQRQELIERLTMELHEAMQTIFGDRLNRDESKEFEVLPGIPNQDLTLELCGKIRQLLAALHEDSKWEDFNSQQRLATDAMEERSSIKIGKNITPEKYKEEWVEFSGNDKYGLVYGPGMSSDAIPQIQKDRELERLYLGWYITLYNVYLQSYPDRMNKIVEALKKAGLPLLPNIQKRLYDRVKPKS